MRKLAFFLFFYSFSFTGKAQYVFTGKVYNYKKEIIPNASVKLKDSIKGFIRFFAISDANGFFHIKIPLATRQLLVECSFIGYKTATFITAFTDTADKKIIRDIILYADTSQLQEINVFSVPPIKVSGDTTTFRTDAFKQGNESNVGDLLNNIPGFSVDNGRIRYNGRTVNRVLIEDDDLFGQDYTTITQNLSPKGIEKIELIDKYNDKTYLGNRMQKGNELVVNLKFDKKYLYRVITSNEIATDPAFLFYKIRQNIVSLIPRVKFVTSTNFNNTGILGSELLGVQQAVPELAFLRKDGINFDLQPLFSAATVSQIPDISSVLIPKNKLVFNHTAMVTNTLLYRASKKLILKNIIQFYSDNYEQHRDRTEDYIFPGINFSVNSRQFLQKKMRSWNISTEAIYALSKATQLVYKINYNTNHERDSSADFRQATDIQNKLGISPHNWQHQIGLTVMPDSASSFDLRAMYTTNRITQEPVISPASYFKTITQDSFFNNIRSVIADVHKEYTLQAKWFSKIKKGFFLAEALFTKNNSLFNSSSILFNTDSSQVINSPSLVNNSVFDCSVGSIGMEISKQVFSGTTIRFSQKLELGSVNFKQQSNVGFSKRYFNYLPAVSFQFNVSKNENLTIQWSVKNKLPQIYDLLPANIIASATEVISGANSINLGLSKTINATYTFTELIKRKLIFWAAAAYSTESVMYLTNRMPGIFYTISNKTAFPGSAATWSFFSNTSKYVPPIKSQLNLEILAMKRQTFYSVNNQTGIYEFSSFTPTIKCKTLVTDKLITTIGVKASFIKQAFDKNQVNSIGTGTQTFTYTGELSYRFSPAFIFNTRYQHISQKQANKINYIDLCDASLKYVLLKDKLSFTLSGNNLFNNRQFASVSFSQLSIIRQTIDMLPSYILVQATIDL
ncbi:MAG: TonB-dependent receptor [Sediminibacterium sp.]